MDRRDLADRIGIFHAEMKANGRKSFVFCTGVVPLGGRPAQGICGIEVRLEYPGDARADPQVRFVKSKPSHILVGDDGRPRVCGELTIDRRIYNEPYDLVVLATGMEPSAVEGYRPTIGLMSDEYGFLVPKDMDANDGIFSCGVAAGPLDVSLSVQSATAAALKAVQAVRGVASEGAGA